MTETIELAVIGAGPAGLTAAIEATELNVNVTLIDTLPQLGGQYFKQTPWKFDKPLPRDKQYQQLSARLDRQKVRLLVDTLVWGIFPENEGYLLCLYGPPATPRRLWAKTVILAPGAYDRPYPFPGWTLPGVMTAGAALLLVKQQQVLPGRRILLSGTGPLQLVLASHLIEGEAKVVGILEANGFPWRAWRYLAAFWGQWERLREGWHSWRVLQQAGAGVRWGHTVFRAEGDGQVDRAVFGPVDGSQLQTVAVDTIVLGYGFMPAVQLSFQAGCEHRYQSNLGGYVPVRDEWLQTTLDGLFVAGDGAGIRGKDVALLEGQLATMGAARHLGRSLSSERVSLVNQKLVRQRQVADVLSQLFSGPSLARDLDDRTIVCRCEEVTAGEVRGAVVEEATTLSAIRMITRVGMGRCQGRMCSSSVAEIIAQASNQPLEAVGYGTPRPPILPVPLTGLLEEER